jgi:fluoride exporter
VLRIALVGAAGALGALSRYAIGVGIGVRSFPIATLLINVGGSGVLGWVLAGRGADRWATTTTTAVAVGFLGAFTTFSTFAYETTTMLRTDQPVRALTYVGLSLGLGLLAAALGYAVGRG